MFLGPGFVLAQLSSDYNPSKITWLVNRDPLYWLIIIPIVIPIINKGFSTNFHEHAVF